ncbi:TIM barrel protein [Pseudomonas sp. TH05]|uniref:sugar phosphate isomerase/epimerase family protein n=1 Tax=unclassified Pseudomonas TaxID=196821 RepID=UPI0019145BBA|nr:MULTISPECIES: TIM barrel protein [unclassified Pseudomonas]MBK5539799.1 TIM barrel protein [Pseudomonas sp. TH07]MBK5554660.1 TIM barrel protein [Pseudomonas sp. TH05]
MQGRLCDRVDGKIQAFPWRDWALEFEAAQRLDVRLMEWTLDQERLYENPLMTKAGRERIGQLSQTHGVRILSLTGDCFMQAPFYKAEGAERASLLKDLNAILDAAQNVGIGYVLIPLVDNGSLTSPDEEAALLEGLLPLRKRLVEGGLKIVFESDFPAERLAQFIARFPEDAFGINYDIGNSAALGYRAAEEIAAYGSRIDNVHVKDRLLGGTTVPLGSGNADFAQVFAALHKAGYAGHFILQTARAEDDNHAGAVARYRDMTLAWWNTHES